MLKIRTKIEMENFLGEYNHLLREEERRLYLFYLAYRQVIQDEQMLKITLGRPGYLLEEITRDICNTDSDKWFWYDETEDKFYIVKSHAEVAEIPLTNEVFSDICWSMLNSGWYKNKDKGDNND